MAARQRPVSARQNPQQEIHLPKSPHPHSPLAYNAPLPSPPVHASPKTPASRSLLSLNFPLSIFPVFLPLSLPLISRSFSPRPGGAIRDDKGRSRLGLWRTGATDAFDLFQPVTESEASAPVLALLSDTVSRGAAQLYTYILGSSRIRRWESDGLCGRRSSAITLCPPRFCFAMSVNFGT